MSFHLPPLKDRKGDIPLLDNYFMEKYNRLDNRNVKGLTEATLELLVGMAWKGNVREMENVLERAILMCKGDFTGEKDLMIQEKSREVVDKAPTLVPTISLKEIERRAIFHALEQRSSNRTRAADILGISVRTLRNKLNEYRERMEAQ